MNQYHELIRHVLSRGTKKGDRTGTGTRSVFALDMRFNLQKGFPLITSKYTAFRLLKEELFWFLRGETNIRPLLAQKVSIWTDWPLRRYRKETGSDITRQEFEARVLEDMEFAAKWGALGPVYGYQWRSWPAPNGRQVDQIRSVQESLRADPDGRRHLVTAWNPGCLDDMALPPCHVMFQFYSRPVEVRDIQHGNRLVERRMLDCRLYQRSADVMLGVPFNVASYALLLHMLAQATGHLPGEFIWSGGDVHIYNNHIDAAWELTHRTTYPLPRVHINPDHRDIDDFRPEDIRLHGYRHGPRMQLPVAV